jgi:hypothetical protein
LINARRTSVLSSEMREFARPWGSLRAWPPPVACPSIGRPRRSLSFRLGSADLSAAAAGMLLGNTFLSRIVTAAAPVLTIRERRWSVSRSKLALALGRAHTIDQIASAYDFGGLYAAGDGGAGATVAVYELEGNFPADITAYQSCFGTDASVSYDPVDGGAGTPNANDYDGIETELDVENLIGLAPKVNVVVYQGPKTAQGGLATYEAIISADTANVIQTSWGECETDLGKTTAEAEATTSRRPPSRARRSSRRRATRAPRTATATPGCRTPPPPSTIPPRSRS